ncbi:MAG: phosphoribosylanthranilate isomerase [Armatimonadota bacterium]|nr:phosphoribosylanthranilate isomerase [Armatimonadota bacterium]MDR5696616.1 phosphoribosylanthranilate isomerase [Armatimonadota bacterium]
MKICGIRTVAAALAAADAGADAVGFVFWEGSRRRVSPEEAAAIARVLPPFVVRVGVFVDGDPEWIDRIRRDVGLDALQLHGNEPPAVCARIGGRVIKALRVRDGTVVQQARDYDVAAILLDTYLEGMVGGTGRSFDWSLAGDVGRPLILSGGLTAANVGDAIRRVRPYAVDVSSGVETDGQKDPAKIAAFVAAVRAADAVAAWAPGGVPPSRRPLG